MKLSKFKKGDIELDEIGKVILALVLLLVLIGIVMYIKGQFGAQGEEVEQAFNLF